MSKASGTSQTPKRFQGRCAGCGREVRADRKGHLWATAPNDGSPLSGNIGRQRDRLARLERAADGRVAGVPS